MISRCYKLGHMSKESHIMIRCEPSLRQRIERIAVLERRTLSDLARLVFEDYVAIQERAFKIALRDQPTPKNVTPLHQNTANSPVAEIRYRKARKK